MKVRIHHLKLSDSHDFGAFANRTFVSVAEATAWISENIPDAELDLVKVWINRRVISGRELKNITGETL